jgi:2-polyprenyl-3-methyl-5-hydroxy-6-metoxy-1,4-benzoquinol methylase
MTKPRELIDTSRSQVVARDPEATGRDAPMAVQQDFWNSWNGIFVGGQRGPISQRQAQIVENWIRAIGRKDLEILEVGCGTGWMVNRMVPLGHVTGTDLSDAVLEIAQQDCPAARFVAGDFMTVDLPLGKYDVIVTLEVLSHVMDQAAFFDRIAGLLKPGGQLMIATQNRPVLERSEDVATRAEGQIRDWVDRHQLRALLAKEFEINELFSICPHGHRGFLRVVNSVKLNRVLAVFFPTRTIDAFKERLWFGHTLMARATARR